MLSSRLVDVEEGVESIRLENLDVVRFPSRPLDGRPVELRIADGAAVLIVQPWVNSDYYDWDELDDDSLPTARVALVCDGIARVQIRSTRVIDGALSWFRDDDYGESGEEYGDYQVRLRLSTNDPHDLRLSIDNGAAVEVVGRLAVAVLHISGNLNIMSGGAVGPPPDKTKVEVSGSPGGVISLNGGTARAFNIAGGDLVDGESTSPPWVELNGGSAADWTGFLKVRADPKRASRCVVESPPNEPLHLARLPELPTPTVEIVGLDVSKLSLANLRRLSDLGRVVPHRSCLQLGSALADHPYSTLPRWWGELLALSKHGGADGSTLSRIRYAEAVTRRNQLRQSRPGDGRGAYAERSVLWLWSLVGYGERVARPLGWWLASAVVLSVVSGATLDTSQGYWASWWQRAFVLILAPLGSVRVDLFENVVGTYWDNLVFIVAQIVGTILVASSLFAASRLVRAGRTLD